MIRATSLSWPESAYQSLPFYMRSTQRGTNTLLESNELTLQCPGQFLQARELS
jgi:hypothetical protein